ncbi:MAG: hypothetical protein ACKPKO_47290, partial [Candidatus Fonsibacter sp.]
MVDVDEENGEFVPATSAKEEFAIVEVVSPGMAPPDAPPVSDSESEPEQATALGQPSLLWPPRILEGYPCPLLTSPDCIERDSGIRPAVVEPPSAEDIVLIEEVDKAVPEVFNKALVGSFREGTLRCLLDITGTFPDRPGGRTSIARGQCRSLSEAPTRIGEFPEAASAPRYEAGHGPIAEPTMKEILNRYLSLMHYSFVIQKLPRSRRHRIIG